MILYDLQAKNDSISVYYYYFPVFYAVTFFKKSRNIFQKLIYV